MAQKENAAAKMPEQLGDADIIAFFANKHGKIAPSKTKLTFLDKHPDIKAYLEQRYSEFHGYVYTVKCIFLGLEDLPRCENCGKVLDRPDKRWCDTRCQLTDSSFIKERNEHIDYQARAERFRQTCQERYGVDAPAQNPEILAKMREHLDYDAIMAAQRETVRQRYGVENVFQLEEVQRKARETRISHRPDDPENHHKAEQTMLERYGVKSALSSGALREKGRKTRQERYGNPDYTNDSAARRTKLERYGDPNYNNPEQHRETCIERYGVPSFSQTEEYAHTRTKTYLWHGISFDSMPELAFYIYHLDHHHDIQPEPVSLTYRYNGKEHVYRPDFMVDGQLYEIKGSHFFENEKMINPFDRTLDDLFEAKHQCMLDNNVIIITGFQKYFQYVDEHYGKDFLSSCVMPKTLSLDYLEYPTQLSIGNINIAVKKAQWREFYKREIVLWEANSNTLRLRLYANRKKYLGKESYELTHFEILRGLNIGGFIKGFTRFNPKQLIRFIETYHVTSIYDPCAGWGERLLTAYMLNIPYLGIDINPGLRDGYDALIAEYGMTQQEYAIDDCATYVPERSFDVAFTCPPYFGQEIYSTLGAENLSHDDFLVWWERTIRNASHASIRYFAYQTNQRTKRYLNPVLEHLGFTKVDQFDLDDEVSHFAHGKKKEYESIEVFAAPPYPTDMSE